MKRLSYFALLSAFLCLAGVDNVWGITYDCAIQTFNVVQSDEITKNVFTITISQKGKSHSSPYSWYNTTATLVLESNDRTLEGTYSSNNADGNNKINTTLSYVMYGSTKRILQSGTASTFRINSVSAGVYRVVSGYGVHTQNEDKASTKQDYLYCYASADPSAADPYASSVASVETTYDFTFTPKYATAPADVTVSAIAGTTATISWTSSESAWQYVCLPASTTLTEALWTSNAVSTNSKSVNLTGLTPATRYKFYVISKNASGTSVIRSTEFTTECETISVFPWNYGFEDCTNDQTPLCWGELRTGGGSVGYVRARTTVTYKKSGSFGLAIYGGNSTNVMTAVFPEFDEDISNLELAFYYKADVDNPDYGDDYGNPQLGYITNATFVPFGEILPQTKSWTLIDCINMSNAPSGARFAIRYSGGTTIGYTSIDDITVSVKPACAKPTSVAVTADSETADGATITWNANGMSAWKLQVSEGDAASWGEEIAVATNSKVLTGLKANTLYYVRVKADCGGGSVSEWSDNVSFTTLCGTINVSATSPWSIDFEGLSELIVPDCWDNSASTTAPYWDENYYIWGTYTRLGNTMLRMNNAYLDGGTALINTPEIAIPNDGNTYELTFDYSNMALVGNNLSVKISANGGAFVEKGVYYPSGNVSSYPGAFSNAVISLADYSGKTIKVQFFTNPTAGTSSEGGAMFVDNVSVHKVSNCIVPTALAAGNLTANSAQITWTAGSSETAWRLQYRADGGDWSSEIAVNTAQYTISGLSANTEYFVRVKAYCDAEDQSNWSDVLSFTTLCAAASMPFSEEFSSASELPSCWEATSTSSYGWSAYEKTGAYSVQLRTGSSGEATLRMPSISLSVDAILQFEWKNANGTQVNLYISTDGGTTKTMIPNDLSGVYANWTTKIFDLSAYTSETALIYFVANFSTVNQYAYLDDVEVIARPCEMILNIQAALITGGATISWSGEVKKLQYKTGSDGWSSVTIPSGDYAGPKTIANLTPARTYQVRLLPACSVEEEGNWTTPIFFTTTSTESVPYFNDFESETPGYVPFNWSRISSSEYPQVSHDAYAYKEGESFGYQGNSIKFYGVNEQIIVLPEFDATLSDLKIAFHYRNRDCTMQLGYVASDGVTFTAIETLPNQTGYGEFPYEKDLYGISGEASKLAIRYSNATASGQAWVDNVSVDNATCGQPTSLSISDITATGAHISWAASERGTGSNYQYINKIWSESDPNWSSAIIVSSSVTELNLTGLTPNKDYEFYLRSYCGVSDQSTPVKVEFKTLVTEEVFEDSPSANNNEARLADLHNQTVSITLNRPLPRNGDYSTICLPFDLTATQIADPDCPLHGFVIKEFDHSGNGEARVNLYLKQVTSIEAGKPYFVRYAGAPTDVALTPLRFLNVKVTASTPAAGEGDDCMAQGIFNPHSLVANDQNTLFLSANNTLYYPTANGTMNGFRVYISVADGSPMHAAIRNGLPISVCEQESTTTTIDSVTQTESTGKGTKIIRNGQLYIIYKGTMYNVQGKRIH